jgi:hypothetical protein
MEATITIETETTIMKQIPQIIMLEVNGTKRMLLGLLLGVGVMVLPHAATAAQAPVPLGSTATFGVLAGTTVTSTGDTIIGGDLGVSTGTTVTGSPGVTGMLHLGDPTAAQAQSDLTIAYNDAAGRTVAPISVAGNLGGQTLAPGLYKSTSSLEISSGDLTLAGDTNAVWIFQMVSTLVTTTGRQVILSGGAQAANVFWQVGSSATIGGSSVINHDGDQRNAGGPGAGPDRPSRLGRQSHYRSKHRNTSGAVGLSGSSYRGVHVCFGALGKSFDQDHNGSRVSSGGVLSYHLRHKVYHYGHYPLRWQRGHNLQLTNGDKL